MVDEKSRILIVDDEPIVCDLLNDDLTHRGYLCTTSWSGRDALTKMESQDFDIALLDIRLPDLSGMQVLSRIAAEHPDIKTIMISALTNPDEMVRALRLGASDYCTKPFALDEVDSRIRTVLETRKNPLKGQNCETPPYFGIKERDNSPAKDRFTEIAATVFAFEAKDEYFFGHSQRVADIAALIAQELELPLNQIKKIRQAGIVHDIGMMIVAKSTLGGETKVTARRYQQIKYHCEVGELILAHAVDDPAILKIVRHHHEQYDGNGYPDGLSGDLIPLGARILAVADTYDAMKSERHYRSVMSVKTARAEIERCKDTQFDPAVADAFLRIRITPYR